MGMTSSSAGPGPSSAGGSKLMSPISDLPGSNAAYHGSSGGKYDSPLEKPWDLPMPTRTAPLPPAMNGGMTPGGLSVHGGWERDPAGQASPGGASTRGNKSASNSPNPNRFSQSFEKAGTGLGDYSNGSMSGRSGSASGPSGAPQRPSRAGTMPLLDAHTGLTAINTAVGPGGSHGITSPSTSTGRPTSTHSPYLSSPHMNSGNSIPSPMPPVPPNYNRAPASTSMLNNNGNGNGGGSHTPTTPMPLQPPPLHHQPFSAPGNPYAIAGLDGEVEKAGFGADDKDEKSKGRERSGTKSSTKEGKKSVFGFMTGMSAKSDHQDRAAQLTNRETIPYRPPKHQIGCCHFGPLRSGASDPRRFQLGYRRV